MSVKHKVDLEEAINQGYLRDNKYEYLIFESIGEICDLWDAHLNDDMMMRSRFLQVIENFPPKNLSFLYVFVYTSGSYIGQLYFQINKFVLTESLKLDEAQSTGIRTSIKKMAAGLIKFEGFTCGNMLVTGDYGSRFDDKVQPDERFSLIAEVSEVVVKFLKRRGSKISTIMLKDYYKNQLPSESTEKRIGYTRFGVQPNMVLNIDDWNTFDDYLGAMKSKYRVRVRRARKKAISIERRELTLEYATELNEKINELYLSTANQAGFNLFYLHPSYFIELKRVFGDLFQIYGFFHEGSLVAFYTQFLNDSHLEAHFLGYNTSYNAEYQLYLNMLYGLVLMAIENGMSKVCMSRTALEIKSSVGAVPLEMDLYIKRVSPMQNRLLPRLLKMFVPEKKWTARSPFK